MHRDSGRAERIQSALSDAALQVVAYASEDTPYGKNYFLKARLRDGSAIAARGAPLSPLSSVSLDTHFAPVSCCSPSHAPRLMLCPVSAALSASR